MEEALRRVASWKSGFLHLSYFGLTELPPLPPTLTKLSCSNNKLTSLPALPAGLETLECENNNLTSLPAFPATLTYLYCAGNQLTKLLALPPTLAELWCYDNKLTSLPTFPPTLVRLICYKNNLTNLPCIPTTLRYLTCTSNNLPVYPNEGEPIQTYEARLRIVEEKHRNIVRCRTLMEELMIICWSPDRLDRLIASYPDKHWNYDLKKYTPLTWNTINEIL